jgi:hypothetical protein
VRDIGLNYPIWQRPYRAAIIETNPKLPEQKIATAAQAVKLRVKDLENRADHHHEVIALTDALTALKILAETIWAELDAGRTQFECALSISLAGTIFTFAAVRSQGWHRARNNHL